MSALSGAAARSASAPAARCRFSTEPRRRLEHARQHPNQGPGRRMLVASDLTVRSSLRLPHPAQHRPRDPAHLNRTRTRLSDAPDPLRKSDMDLVAVGYPSPLTKWAFLFLVQALRRIAPDLSVLRLDRFDTLAEQPEH